MLTVSEARTRLSGVPYRYTGGAVVKNQTRSARLPRDEATIIRIADL